MNNKTKIIFVSFLLLLLLVSNVKAEIDEIPDIQETETFGKIEDTKEKISELSDEDIRSQYLKEEWTKLLEKGPVGQFLIKISNLFKYLNPLFLLFLKVEYTLSWIFFLTLAFWLTGVMIVYIALKTVFPNQKIVVLGISAAMITLGARFNAIDKLLTFFSPLFTSKWIIIITLVVAFILLQVYKIFMKKLGKHLAKGYKTEKEKGREEKAKLVEKINDITIKANKPRK